MQIGDRFIGRDREAAQLELSIGPGDDGLRLVMVTGPSGMGKTTLTHVVLRKVADRGFDVAVANGRAGSLSTPFAPWVEALPELRAIIDSMTQEGHAADMDRVGAGLVALLAERTVARPLVLVFDDSQALDESSIALLSYAAGVSERMNLTLLLVEQSDAVDVSPSYRSFADGLLARRVVQHLELGPMTDESIRELAGAVLEVDQVDAVPTEIILRAQGNPWFAKELAESFGRGESDIPVSIAAAATARLHRLDDTAQDIVYAVALSPEGAYIGWLEALAGQRPREFVRTMESIKASGLIREDDEFIAIAHPLMRQALLDELSAAMRRALHLELAEVVASTPMSEVTSARAQGYHLSQAGKPDEAVDHYLRAAEANEILGQLHEAFADYSRALESEPRIERRMELLRQCAFAAMQIGNDRAVEYWTELGRIASARNDNETYAHALFQQYWTSYDGTALDRLERAAALGPDDFGWSARAAACMRTLAADYEGAIAYDTRAIELARQSGDALLETLAQEKLGLSYSYVGRLPEAIEALTNAVAKATAQRLHSWAIEAWETLAEMLADTLETERSLAECRAVLKYVDDLGLERRRPGVLAFLALALVRRGMVTEAERYADEGFARDHHLVDDHQSPLVVGIRAEVASEAGNFAVAETAFKAALAAADHHGYVSWAFEFQRNYGLYLARISRVDEALKIWFDLDVNEPIAMANLALCMARVGAWHGRKDAIERAATIAQGITSDVPLIRLLLDEVAATSAADGDPAAGIDALCAVADEWNRVGRPLDALRAMVSMGIAQVRAGKVKEAIQALNNAREGFTKCGAAGDQDFIAGQLRALGARSRAKSRSTTVGNLTKRELEIARLVASGMRNAEVAGQLFLAEKTVAAHLSNIYGKLEVRSRVQLAAWLKENDPGVESVVA